MITNPWKSYQKVATQTATPGHLVLMLFDGSLKFLEQARLGFKEEDPLLFNQTISNNIIRTQAILHELDMSLDMERGGQFATTMRGLYTYLDRRLQESNLKKQQAGVEDAIRRITILRDAWSEMLSGSPKPDPLPPADFQARLSSTLAAA